MVNETCRPKIFTRFHGYVALCSMLRRTSRETETEGWWRFTLKILNHNRNIET